MVSQSVHLVRSTKTRLSLSHQLARLYTTKLPTPTSTTMLQQCSIQSTYDSLLRTVQVLQQLAYVRLTVRASNQIDLPPRLTQRTVKTGTSIYQPRPTSANHDDRPTAHICDSIDLSSPQRSSSCILRLDRPQLPATIVQLHSTTQSTATRIKHPAAHIYDSTIPAIDITHLAEDPNTTATDFTHALVNTTINCHLCCICYLTFVSFIVFGCHCSHALT